MPAPNELLAHEAELRALAVRLVADAHLADDLVQETYLRALEREAGAGAGLRRWLREILRLAARHARAREVRRHGRERCAAARVSERGDAPDERAALLQALAEEVATLEEPYRSTLLLRFFEQRPPREIARQLGVPVRTVYTRIARGTERLRERLSRRYGALWVGPLAALLGPPRAAPARGWIALAACTGVVAALVLWIARDPPSVASLAAPARADVAPSRPSAFDAPASARTPAAEPPAAPMGDASSARVETAAVYRGRVVDPDGRPQGGVDVVLEQGDLVADEDLLGDYRFDVRSELARAASHADGSFEIADRGRAEGRIVARGPGLAPLIAAIVPSPVSAAPLELVVAPERSVEGTVCDERGAPLPDVRATLRPPLGFLASVRRLERTWSPAVPEARTDAAGRFELAGAFDLARARLELARPGFETASIELASGPIDLRIALRARAPGERPLRGRVRTKDGSPVEGATVVAGTSESRSAPDGTFELDPAGLVGARRLWAVAHGLQPATLELARRADGSLDVPDEIVLEISEPALAIGGRVVDGEGRPLEGAYVWCADATPMGVGKSTWMAELHMDPAGRWSLPYGVGSGADGAFRFPYLLERAYRIGALWVPTGASVLTEPVRAGSGDVVIRLPIDDPRPRVAGRVEAREGQPLGGVQVAAKLDALEVELAPGRTFVASLALATAVTADDGRFDLGSLPIEGCRLHLSGDRILPRDADLPDVGRESLHLVAARRAELRVVLAPEVPADRFALLSAEGRPLRLYPAETYDGTYDLNAEIAIAIGSDRARTVVAPDTACTLLLLSGDAEAGRFPIDLSPDRPNLFRR